MTQNWRMDGEAGVDAGDYFLRQKKQAEVANRRPVIRRASDLVGPGIAQNAVRITNFSDVLATFNGFFSADVDAIDAPLDDEPFVGWVSSDATLGGVQLFTGLETNREFRRAFRRNPADAATMYWTAWEEVT